MAISTMRATFFISFLTFVILVSIASIFIIHHQHHHSKIVYSNFSASFPVSLYGGGYTFDLSLGNPIQNISLTIDTGSGPVWVPCLSPFTNYTCSICNSSGLNFKPDISSSFNFMDCTDSRCKLASMHACYPTNRYCHYQQYYGIGDTAGLLSIETLHLGNHSISQFIVGCSTNLNQLLTGLAGFNNHPASLPKQLQLRKFAYCFSSSDDNGTLILGCSNDEVKNLSYTPFLASSDPDLQQFYYVLLRTIIVGNTRINIPRSYMSSNNGVTRGQGMLVDSSTTRMLMVTPIFNLVASEFVKVLGDRYPSERYLGTLGSNLCFQGLTLEKSKIVPKLIFEFDGGADMELSIENYFEFVDTYACLVIDDIPPSKNGLFYAIIFGNIAQQNFYVEYDIENRRLGFKPYICTL